MAAYKTKSLKDMIYFMSQGKCNSSWVQLSAHYRVPIFLEKKKKKLNKKAKPNGVL